MKKYVAESFGTLVLSLAVLASLIKSTGFPTALVAGITLTLLIFMIGGISGAHVNPAVTLGAYFMKKISRKEALMYILFQFIGALGAIIIVTFLGFKIPLLTSVFSFKALIAELLGTAIFVLGIASALHSSKENIFVPFVIGGSLSLGAIIAGIGSNGVLNPAVGFAIGSFNLAYIVGPLLGAYVGVWLYKKICA